MKVGILAIQGDFSLHKKSLDKIGVESLYVRDVISLKKCDSLIFPGGESTTMSLLLSRYKLDTSIYDFSLDHSIFGICAGSILMSEKSHDSRINNLNLIKMDSLRNAWGSQIHSFSAKLNLEFDKKSDFEAVFIRAQKISKIGKNIKILATYKNQPVMITDGQHCVCSFHPEIGLDMRIHKYYLNQING